MNKQDDPDFPEVHFKVLGKICKSLIIEAQSLIIHVQACQ